MKQVIITVGVSASGKSSWAEEFVASKIDAHEKWVIICRDNIRAQIFEEKFASEFIWGKWNWKWEKEVTARQQDQITKARNDKSVDGIIIADTNLNNDRLVQLEKTFVDQGDKVTIQFFPINIEEAWARDAARKNGVGHAVIAKQMDQWNEMMHISGSVSKYTPNNRLPVAVMVDVDGTLAHMNGKRSPFEWAKVGVDDCDMFVAEIVRGLFSRGFKIIIMSGRDSVCFNETVDWLESNDIPFSNIWMRAKDDMRKDALVKSDLFWEHVAPHYNVVGVIDDRPVMVRKWQELGIKTLAAGNQNIEF